MAIFDTGAGGKQNLKFITAGAEHILEGYVGADAKGKPKEGEFSIESQLIEQETRIAAIKELLSETVFQTFRGFESGKVFTGAISIGGTVNTSVTLASSKRPKVVLSFACYQDKLTINTADKSIGGISTYFGVGITVDRLVAFEGQHYTDNTRRHKAIINDDGFTLECKNLGTSLTAGYYCDWIAFY